MFKLQNPTTPDRRWKYITITQLFGANDCDFYSQMGIKGHNGIDFRTINFQDGKAPVFAAHDGYIVSDKTIQSDTAGRFVKILSDETEIDGKKCKVESCYFHLSEVRLSITDSKLSSSFWPRKNERFVKAGTLVGLAGNTGKYTTGPHLHFHIRILWKQLNGLYQADSGNGYDGCINPFFKDDEIYSTQGTIINPAKHYFNGVEITYAKANKILAAKPGR
jgi:murein DD-endopeptidase MepM/ murein hydrolase activator NlpD